jgi:hypothetical protein
MKNLTDKKISAGTLHTHYWRVLTIFSKLNRQLLENWNPTHPIELVYRFATLEAYPTSLLANTSELIVSQLVPFKKALNQIHSDNGTIIKQFYFLDWNYIFRIFCEFLEFFGIVSCFWKLYKPFPFFIFQKVMWPTYTIHPISFFW